MRESAIFLDANAGDAPAEAVRRLLAEAGDRGLSLAANPSSAHAWGRSARARLLEARAILARAVGARLAEEGRTLTRHDAGDELIFVSSGTEANQALVRGLLESAPAAWAASAGEHESLAALEPWARARGAPVAHLALGHEGELRLDEEDRTRLAQWAAPSKRLLLTLAWGNNETGVIQDLARVRDWLAPVREAGIEVWLHADACQMLGRVAIADRRDLWDSAAFSAAKVGGLAGSGVLVFSRERARRWGWTPLFPGSQERGTRGGTENALGALAFAAAAAERTDPAALAGRRRRWLSLRGIWERALLAELPDAVIYGGGAGDRLPQTLAVGVPGVERAGLAAALDLAGFAASAGAACSAGAGAPARSVLAMTGSEGRARAMIRISFSADDAHLAAAEAGNAAADFAAALARAAGRLRAGETGSR